MREGISKKNPTQKPERTLNRRNFLSAGAANIGLGLIGYTALKNHKSTKENLVTTPEPSSVGVPDYTAEIEPELTDQDVFEQYENLSDSGYFYSELDRLRAQYERDLPVVLDRMEVLAIIQATFTLSGIADPVVRANLEGVISGLAIEESRLDCNAKSSVGAFGCLQLMPATWNELKRSGESSDNLIDTINVAARLLEQSYNHLTNSCHAELQQIETTFFAGDHTLFASQFLTPLLLNSYNAGMGSMATLVRWFVERFPDMKSTVDIFEQSEILTGYDVFIALAHVADQEEVVKWYKTHASDYTCKAYAAQQVLNNAFAEQAED